jgi:Terpene synthase family 2, C-terminal metal binding
MATGVSRFHLPKLFCPFSPEIHPLMGEIEREALARWARYLGMRAKHKVFKKLQHSHFPTLLGRCHPTASSARIQAALDFLIWNFSWDDQVDVGDVPPEWINQQNDMALAILRGGIPYPDASPLLCLLETIREGLAQLMPPSWMERFIQACTIYFQGTVWEAETRARRECLDVETYLQLRRQSVGTYMVFTQIEAIEGMLLPQEVLEHPAFRLLVDTATDIIGWANDLFSLAQDLKDDFHPNLVLSLRHHQGLELQQAINVAVEMHDAAVRRFLELEKALPPFPGHDEEVAQYVLGMRRWIRANVDWSIQTGRYQEEEEPETGSFPGRVA